MRKSLIAVLVALTLASSFAAGAGPRVSIPNLAALKAPLPYPYAENSDAKAAVAQAFARAKASGKRVLIDFGGNWCPDCRILAGVMDLPEVKSYLAGHYEVVTVDVGMFDKNLDVVRRFGIEKLKGVPTVVIASRISGKFLSASSACSARSSGRTAGKLCVFPSFRDRL